MYTHVACEHVCVVIVTTFTFTAVPCDLGSSPFVVPLDDPDLAFGMNEIGVRPVNMEAVCDQRRINRLNFDIIVDRKLIVLIWICNIMT